MRREMCGCKSLTPLFLSEAVQGMYTHYSA